jgi:exonuclease VII small subunit
MLRKNLWLIVLAVTFLPYSAVADTGSQEKAAVSAAQRWLAMVDSGNYGESWQEASELFRNAVTAAQWQQSLQGARKPLGKLISRKVKTASYKTSLPGAPDGKYVVIQFDTSFEKKKSALETVTPMMEQDGKWRVSGYYIK